MFGRFPDRKVSKAMTSFPVYYWSQLTQIPNGFLTNKTSFENFHLFWTLFSNHGLCHSPWPPKTPRALSSQLHWGACVVWWFAWSSSMAAGGRWVFHGSSTAGGECKHCNLSCKSHMTGIAWAPHGKQSLAFIHRLSHPNFYILLHFDSRKEVKNVPTSFPFGHLTLHRYFKIHRPSVCIPLCFVLRFPLCLGFGLCFRSFACFCSDTWVKSLHWDTI